MWQATATIVVGLLVGIPLGIVAGRELWTAFADQLDVVSNTSVPTVLLVVVTAAGLLIANLAAAVPARMARRLQPAEVLRSE